MAERAEPAEKDVASQIRDAMRDRHSLEIQLAEAMDHEDEAEMEMRPYQAAFAAAHKRLEDVWMQPETTTADRLSLYTARMWAGHARHPFKVRVDELAGWRKRIEHDLRAANAIIERLTKPRAKLRGNG